MDALRCKSNSSCPGYSCIRTFFLLVSFFIFTTHLPLISEKKDLPIPTFNGDFDISHIERIRVGLSHDDQKVYRKHLGRFYNFLLGAYHAHDQFTMISKKDYDRIYSTYTNAVGRLVGKWKNEENWKALYPVSRWFYEIFPYKSGWIYSNKNELENYHKKVCSELKNIKSYRFKPALYRKEYHPAETKMSSLKHQWPTKHTTYSKNFDLGDVNRLRMRLEKIEYALHNIKDNQDLDGYQTAIQRIRREIDSVQHVFNNSKLTHLAEKTEKLFIKTLTSRNNSIKDALKMGYFEKGLKEKKAYRLARNFYEETLSRNLFSQQSNDRIGRVMHQLKA